MSPFYLLERQPDAFAGGLLPAKKRNLAIDFGHSPAPLVCFAIEHSPRPKIVDSHRECWRVLVPIDEQERALAGLLDDQFKSAAGEAHLFHQLSTFKWAVALTCAENP